MYLDVVGALDPTFTVPADLLHRIRHELRVSGTDAASRLVPDDVLDRFAFAGTPEAVATHALEVLGAGASRIDFGTPHGTSDDHGLELLGAAGAPGYPGGDDLVNPCEVRNTRAGLRRRHDPGAVQEGVHPVEF